MAIDMIGRENWDEFVNGEGVAVLMLAKTDCAACAAWTEELSAFLETEHGLEGVRFGKMFLNTPGLGKFKRASPWLSEVHDLPYNVLYKDGEIVKRWVGGGADRLANRVKRVL